MTERELNTMLRPIAEMYPDGMAAHQLTDAGRIAFNLSLLDGTVPPGGAVADIGGGLGLFTPGLVKAGYKSILVDDFRDRGNIEVAERVFDTVHRPMNVQIVSRDVIADGVDFAPASLDGVTTFDSMEHWHHSPKKLFGQLIAALRPGGAFIIGVPNSANLRKRFTALFGNNSWSPMSEWYEAEVFRAHVREPDVRDLRYIAKDLGLVDVRIVGRNWLGYQSGSSAIRTITAILDRPIRLRPGLCADIYLVARKASR